jgi:hypothetical protein
MNLLALPPEIFQRVVQLYVKKAGIAEAWKLRRICSKCHLWCPMEDNIAKTFTVAEGLYLRVVSRDLPLIY